MLVLLLVSICTTASAQQLAPLPVAPNVYLLPGSNGEISQENRGEVANTGFIVGDDGVLAIDTGISADYGRRMLRAIAAVTSKKIRFAVLTHPVQEFIFGAIAFQKAGVPVLAQRQGAELIQQRCAHCLKTLLKTLGTDVMKDTAVIQADRLIDTTTHLDLGHRPLDLMTFSQASTPGDLAVFDRSSGTLYAGGLITAERIPNLRDGKFKGWVAALKTLRKLPQVRQIVPGFGPVGGKVEIDRMLDYLTQLDSAVRKRYRDGDSLIETMRSVDLPMFRNWRGYDTTHPQNVLYVYRAIENADFH